MENKHPHQLFLDTWKLIHQNVRMFKYWLDKGDLLPSEKKLLKAFYYYKKNKKHECLELLKNGSDDLPFLKAMRFYLVGLVYNQHGHYLYAIENLKKSIECFQSCHDQHFILNPICLLANVYGNRRDLREMANCIDELKEYKPENAHQELQVDYAELCYLVLARQTLKALALIKRVESKNYKEYNVFKPYFLINQIMLAIQETKYEKCYALLSEYQTLSGHVVKANYTYIKLMLDHLTEERPLYIYAQDFIDFPELHWQLEVIRHLHLGERVQALHFWGKLAKHNQELYQGEFSYQGEESLFSILLERYKHFANKHSFSEEELPKHFSISEKLFHIFNIANSPISQEELIELLWQEEMNEKNRARLRKAISEYSKKYHQTLKSSQGSYQVLKKAA
jgi:hypothetical protein